MSQTMNGGASAERGDVVIDVSGNAYETGFKFNTIPFGGMTIDTHNAVRIGSAADVKLVPPSGYTVVIGTTGILPTASADLRGALFVVQGAGGVADTLQVCLKAAGGGFSWKLIQTG
jgi:hypothetical protein